MLTPDEHTELATFVNHTDEQLVAVITSLDRQGLPLSRRFEGDDQPLRDAMTLFGVSAHVGLMDMVAGLAMREALTRGLTIPVGN